MIEEIIKNFCVLISYEWKPADVQVNTLTALLAYSDSHGYPCSAAYEDSFYEAVNQKLESNRLVYQHILDTAFLNGIKLNHLLKTEIRRLLDCGDTEQYKVFLLRNGIISNELSEAFSPVERAVTLQKFNEAKENDPQFQNTVDAVFSRYCFNLFDQECTSLFFSGENRYIEDYFAFIEEIYPDMCRRDRALSFIDVTEELFQHGYVQGCNAVLNAVRESYQILNNHCEMAVYIPEIIVEQHCVQWELFSDVVLYAEKMNPEKIDRVYFRWKKIKHVTESYIQSLDGIDAEFGTAFQGFVFKDCFILQQSHGYSLLLIFEKNQRDERLLYCPACRSLTIEGNSYPMLNVRSWECKNPLCPDRSRYNRGKRYSFFSIMRQKLMADEENRIPESSIASWRLDYVEGAGKPDAFAMVLRHYSCMNDGVFVYATQPDFYRAQDALGRKVEVLPFLDGGRDIRTEFKCCAYFQRYFQTDSRPAKKVDFWKYDKAVIYHGDSLEVLKGFSSNTFDGAVTSPPYYNAKNYSQWDNIYCYLYDMYNISAEIYRVLKPGAVYLFNIFDYFDNERNIVFSAMGNKRMILGAYMLDIFGRIGFSIQGNIIWYKGEIQGNRSFNQGNMTPYYQAPLNCWEHVFILSKGVPDEKWKEIKSSVAAIRPVVKMVRGKNVLGHTAPYPVDIPNLLLSHMDAGDIILDPFLGSGTTCRAAEQKGIRSVGIERSLEYVELSKKMISY